MSTPQRPNQPPKGRKPDRFWKNAITLAGGNTASRLIIIAFVPVVTRLFTPESFGVFNIYLTLADLVAGVSSLRYNAAILLPREHDEAHHILLLCLALVAGFGILTALVTGICAPLWQGRGAQNGMTVFAVLWLAVILEGGTRAMSFWLLRFKRFRQLTVAQISDALTNRGVTITSGLLGYVSPWGLVAGRLLGRIMGLVLMLGLPNRRIKGRLPGSWPWDRIKVVAARYSEFPRYSYTSLLQSASNKLPILMLWALYPSATVGIYALSNRILGEPVLLIGTAMQKTLYSHASNRMRRGASIKESTEQIFSYFLDIIAMPLLSLSLFAPPLVGLVFGSQWIEAGRFIVILIPLYVAMLSSIPLACLFDVYQRQKERMIFNALKLAAAASAFALGGLLGSVYTAITLFSLFSAVVFLGGIYYLLGLSGSTRSGITVILIKKSAKAAALLSVPALLSLYGWASPLTVMALCLVLAAANIISLYRRQRPLPDM